MKYLGIDYGTKKIGLAISDERGKIAFPRDIIPNTSETLSTLIGMIHNEAIEKIVIGKSLDSQGSDNAIQRHINTFVKKLSQEFDGEIFEQDERGSSVAARGHLYRKGNIENEQWTGRANKKRRDHVDAGAAAVILQRYLDKNN